MDDALMLRSSHDNGFMVSSTSLIASTPADQNFLNKSLLNAETKSSLSAEDRALILKDALASLDRISPLKVASSIPISSTSKSVGHNQILNFKQDALKDLSDYWYQSALRISLSLRVISLLSIRFADFITNWML